MRKLAKEDKAGLYITVIVHLAVLIVLLAVGLDFSLQKENSFVLDFSKLEEKERMIAEIERLQKEAELQEAINRKIEQELGSLSSSSIRNIAVDRASLKDDRGTDAEQLYKDAERLQRELSGGFSAPEDDRVDIPSRKKEESRKEKAASYSGPSVVDCMVEGRHPSKLPIPAYRCMGEGSVKVNIAVDNAGNVTSAKIDEGSSSTDGCLRSFAIRAARLSKFNADPKASPKQTGYIVYQFIAQ